MHVATFAGSVYGAYFGAGVSVLLLGVLGLFLSERLNRVNALRSALVLVINTVALLIFVALAPVQWLAVAIMATTSLAGGWVGASFARRLDPRWLRAVVTSAAVVVAIVLLVR